MEAMKKAEREAQQRKEYEAYMASQAALVAAAEAEREKRRQQEDQNQNQNGASSLPPPPGRNSSSSSSSVAPTAGGGGGGGGAVSIGRPSMDSMASGGSGGAGLERGRSLTKTDKEKEGKEMGKPAARSKSRVPPSAMAGMMVRR
jgi:hypothetical protein